MASKQLISKLFELGYADLAIATRLGISIAEVRRQSPVPLAMTAEAWEEADALHPDASDKELKLLYNTNSLGVKRKKVVLTGAEIASYGRTTGEIANNLKLSPYKVRKLLGNVHSKQSTPNKVKDWNAVLEYRKANSLAATAKKFGVTPSAISQYIKRHKL